MVILSSLFSTFALTCATVPTNGSHYSFIPDQEVCDIGAKVLKDLQATKTQNPNCPREVLVFSKDEPVVVHLLGGKPVQYTVIDEDSGAFKGIEKIMFLPAPSVTATIWWSCNNIDRPVGANILTRSSTERCLENPDVNNKHAFPYISHFRDCPR